jgi:flagellar M-ring protein FliF
LKTLVIGAVAIMVILMVIKPLVNRAFEIAPADDAEGAAILASGGPDMSALLGKDDIEDDPFADVIAIKTGAAAIKKVIELANSNPEETLAVLRAWMLHKK